MEKLIYILGWDDTNDEFSGGAVVIRLGALALIIYLGAQWVMV